MDLVPKIRNISENLHIPLTIVLHNMVTVMPTIRFNRGDEDEKLRSSDKSDKSMDLWNLKSEDLSKDLQVNLRISPQMQGFHDELDE